MENGKGIPNPNHVNQVENIDINVLDSTNNVGNSAGGSGGGDDGRRRTPFTNLSQVDADFTLARILQEQERAYMMLSGHDDDEEDEFDVHGHGHESNDEVDDHLSQDIEIDPFAFSNDESYATALHNAERRERANIMDTGEENEDEDYHDGVSQDVWGVDELLYEELTALGEVVGTESKGLSVNTIASLPSTSYRFQEGNIDSCVICRLDYEDGDTLTVLLCKHSYHSDCINQWLQINKVCPVCNVEVSTTRNN